MNKKIFIMAIIIMIIFSSININAVNLADIKLGENPNIRVGLIYGTGMVESLQTINVELKEGKYDISENGFIIGEVKENASDVFNGFIYIANNKIAVSHGTNLAKNSAGKYYASSNNIKVGKYSAEFINSFNSFADAQKFINNLPKSFENSYICYINGKIIVRSGDFSSETSMRDYIAKANNNYKLTGAMVSSETAIVINPENDEILFEYENNKNNLSIIAAKTKNQAVKKISEIGSKETGFTQTPANNIYSGAFIYKINSKGVEVINLVALEDYIKGVVPNEMSPSFEPEALKAFSLAARTYAVNSLNAGKHLIAGTETKSGEGFSLCNTVHCQLFIGSKNATEKTNSAVDATKGQILTYQGKVIEAVYHSSSGGATENHNDAWGGTFRYPYLAGVKLPLEDYTNPTHKNALWTKTASPKELYEYLTQTTSNANLFKGIINSNIASIKINSRSASNYIKSLTVTDINGHSVTVENSDKIRISFARYANSANMEIYKSSKFKSWLYTSKMRSASADIEAGKTYIATGNGLSKIATTSLNILSANGTANIKAYATGSDFVFDGKGWGHGVGMSQWATQDMALAGQKSEDIVKTFYTGVVISKMK